MKIFYTGSDIEELAATGVTRLEIGPGVTITDVGREMAEELGIELVMVSAAGGPLAPAPAPQARTAPAVGAKPRGCQHGPLPGLTSTPVGPAPSSATPNRADGIVSRLVNIVSRLADQGG